MAAPTRTGTLPDTMPDPVGEWQAPDFDSYEVLIGLGASASAAVQRVTKARTATEKKSD